MYIYKIEYVSNYDGDTITVDIDLGFGIWSKNQRIRLSGVNTPELKGEFREAGLVAKAFVQAKLKDCPTLVLHSIKDSTEKYGRWLGVIYYNDINLNDELIHANLAVAY